MKGYPVCTVPRKMTFVTHNPFSWVSSGRTTSTALMGLRRTKMFELWYRTKERASQPSLEQTQWMEASSKGNHQKSLSTVTRSTGEGGASAACQCCVDASRAGIPLEAEAIADAKEEF
jgi:hypothetical protein